MRITSSGQPIWGRMRCFKMSFWAYAYSALIVLRSVNKAQGYRPLVTFLNSSLVFFRHPECNEGSSLGDSSLGLRMTLQLAKQGFLKED